MSKNIIIGIGKFAYSFLMQLYDKQIPVSSIDRISVIETCYVTSAVVANNKVCKPVIRNRESGFFNMKQRVRKYDNVILIGDDTCDLADALRGLMLNPDSDDNGKLIKRCIAITTIKQLIKHSGWFYSAIGNGNVLQVNNDAWTPEEILNFIKEKTGNENAK